MTRHPSRLAASLVAVLLSAGCPPEERRHVTILFTTDEHSQVFADGPELDDWTLGAATGPATLRGGMARRAAVIAAERAVTRDVVVLSSGDATQGTLAAVPFPVADFDHQLMKAAGYDAAALGNHEFDQTPLGLAMAVAAATTAPSLGAPPLVLTNVKFSGTAADAPLAALHGPGRPIVPSRVITTQGGYKVGVVASMGLSAARDAAPFAAPVTFTDGVDPVADPTGALAAIAAQLQPAIDAMRPSVQVVVLLSHGGVPEAGGQPEDERLLARLRGVDLVLSGHTHVAAQALRYAQDADGRRVPLMQASPYGRDVGRIVLRWRGRDRPTVDGAPGSATYVPVDARIPPIATGPVPVLVQALVGALEDSTSSPSFLAQTLYAVTGAPVAHDPAHPGDLYFYPLCHTGFGVAGRGTGESNLLNLDTDAMRWSAALFSGAETQVALQARGAIRADLLEGATGVVAFADAYRIVPLGLDPRSGNPGYPVLRFALALAELRAAIEGTLLMSVAEPDYFVAPSGLEVAYDMSRPTLDPADPIGPGWTTSLALVAADGTRTYFYVDGQGVGGWLDDPTRLVTVAATYQLAAFAGTLGLAPRDPATGAPATDLESLFVLRPDDSVVNDHQSFASYLSWRCRENGGELPSEYDAATPEGTVPRRICAVACP